MHDQRSHPLLQQTPLSVNPFIDLPKPPTLPHNYATLPSTLPPSSMTAAPAGGNSELPAYVTSSSGFAAHPSTIVAQNKALLEQMARQRKEAQERVANWEQEIRDKELQEKRRKAPGWLDSDSKLLEPERSGLKRDASQSIEAPTATAASVESLAQAATSSNREVDDLGAAMDRAFGRSEMG